MRYPSSETADKHERILQEAARLFRERGFEDVTVAEVMKAAGLTHGPFYSHFQSKDELMAEAVGRAMDQTLDGVKRSFTSAEGRQEYIGRYLSKRHRDKPGAGCAMAALVNDVRHEAEAQHTFTAKLTEILAAMGGERGEAMMTLSAMVGAMALARAVDDEGLSLELLSEVKKQLQ